MVYIDLSMTDTRNGRMPTGLEKKNSIDVQIATATQRRTENIGESVPGNANGLLVSNNPFHVLPRGNTSEYVTPPSTSKDL